MSQAEFPMGDPAPVGEARPVHEAIHFRIHDAISGRLLDHGSEPLTVVIGRYQWNRDNHPRAHLVVEQYDQPHPDDRA